MLAIAAVALIVVLAIPLFIAAPPSRTSSSACSAMALFATSLNMLVGNTGMVSFGHGMFYGLGAYAFALTMQMTSCSMPVAAVLAVLLTTFGALCRRRDLRPARHGLFRLHHARNADADAQHHHLLAELTGGDQGLRGGIPRREIFGFELASQHHLYQF